MLNRKLVVNKYSKPFLKKKKIMIYLVILGILLLGTFYQIYSVYGNADQYGRVGKLINVNNAMMHLYTSLQGETNTIPLVFASNIASSVPYTQMYPLISQLTDSNIAVYDKFGYGWSDLTHAPRDISTIASEIHSLLHQSEYPLPAIFVAHSMGSLEVLRYAQLYPEDVAGIVLIDGAAPEFCSTFNNIMIIESFLMNFLRNTGGLRLLQNNANLQKILNPNANLPENLQYLNQGITLEKYWNRNMIAEKLKLKGNAKVILEHGTLKDIPLHIITSRANPYGTWQKTQLNMRQLSSNTSQTYIEGSVDFIEEQDLDTIIDVIETLSDSLKE